VEYDQMQSGMRREDIFSGMWSAGQKIGYSVSPPIVGFALASSARYPLKANGMID
jgi:Na+/melibiose symporter-like transporter